MTTPVENIADDLLISLNNINPRDLEGVRSEISREALFREAHVGLQVLFRERAVKVGIWGHLTFVSCIIGGVTEAFPNLCELSED